MHSSSFNGMNGILRARLDENAPLRILDVGSRSNRAPQFTYRQLMPAKWVYFGCDMRPGPNVDILMPSSYHIQDAPNEYDAVISGQCLEHVERFWLLVPEMSRVLKPGGLMVVAAPWKWNIHKNPLESDCWRILPDGMKILLQDAGLADIIAYTLQYDCWGIGYKVKQI